MSLIKVMTCGVLIFLISCNKEDAKTPPTINFKQGSRFTLDGDKVKIGNELIFGIQASGNDANITNFTIKKFLTDGSSVTIMDTSLNAESLNIEKVFYQSIEEEVEWVFTVMDKNRLSSDLSLTVYKDPNSQFGGIYYYPSITLGYQYNTDYGHFLDPFSGKVCFDDSAAMFQNDMHILVYYIVSDDLPSPVFSSPGEVDNFSEEAKAFYPFILNWQVRRFTKWDISVDDTPISTQAFEEADNDSLLIVSYNEVWGKKKFRWATNGRIIPFKTAYGKFGLLKVITAENSESGKIEFAVKIQD
jgi:hypothetical protein